MHDEQNGYSQEAVNFRSLYRDDRTSVQAQQNLERLTSERHWDSDRFRAVVVTLASLGEGKNIPSPNRPESINLTSWRPILNSLTNRQSSLGKEIGLMIFADLGSGKLMTGKTTIGKIREVAPVLDPKLGRAALQKPVIPIHTHPTDFGDSILGNTFSEEDLVVLLGNPDLRAMMVGYGEGDWLLALKTSVTPNNLSEETIRRRVRAATEDAVTNRGAGGYVKGVLAVNGENRTKEICTHLGMHLYATSNQDTVFRRVDVT